MTDPKPASGELGSDYVTTEQLAAYFKVSTATILSMVHDGSLPTSTYVKLGRVYRFHRSEVEEVLRTRNDDMPPSRSLADLLREETAKPNQGDDTDE